MSLIRQEGIEDSVPALNVTLAGIVGDCGKERLLEKIGVWLFPRDPDRTACSIDFTEITNNNPSPSIQITPKIN